MIADRQTLNPALPVLQRPDGTVQLGWDPRRAIGIRPPDGLSVGALADLLRRMFPETDRSGLTTQPLTAQGS